MVVGLRCVVCGEEIEISRPMSWTCPRATEADPFHVLEFVDDGALPTIEIDRGESNPFVRYRERMGWWAFARANGMSDDETVGLARSVAGQFSVTPLQPHDGLSDVIGRSVWAKNETVGVSGSHKSRHLVGIMLHLIAAEQLGMLTERPPLAISSCGNAALAAATVASSQEWPLRVFVPTWMDDSFGSGLDALGAEVNRCERIAGAAGDPAMSAFREAVSQGAIPFSVQGPANAWCLDGGRTIGWELHDQLNDVEVAPQAVFVQVGGGALATSLALGLGDDVPLVVVQAEGCAPLHRALQAASRVDAPELHWAELMQPWESPHSLADGILDDETYDWISIGRAIERSSGRSVVAAESEIVHAHKLVNTSGPPTSATGTAGVAGALGESAAGTLDDRPIVVLLSGAAR